MYFKFLWEKCLLAIYRIYLYIVQIYLCIRDSKIQNIYSVLFDILEAVDWCETYQKLHA